MVKFLNVGRVLIIMKSKCIVICRSGDLKDDIVNFSPFPTGILTVVNNPTVMRVARSNVWSSAGAITVT